jgi:ribosome assembly protein YihI (activator of Der GTPase)
MSAFHNILTRIDTNLDSIIHHPVWFGSAVTDDADNKMKAFRKMCMDSTTRKKEIQETLDEWLKNYDAEQKLEFCSQMYVKITQKRIKESKLYTKQMADWLAPGRQVY